MDPVTRAVLLSWEWRVAVLLPVLLLAALYTLGWRRLRTRTRAAHRLANGWRLAAYLVGLIFILFALISPIDVLGGQLFFMHMIQHLLLVMLAPPLLMLANPLPFLLWGLPESGRRQVGGFLSSALHRESRVRQLLRSLTGPGIVWLLYVVFLLGWHDPNLYNAALRSELVHDIEHLTFFGSAMLYWWHVVGAGPRIHKQFGRAARVAYVIAAIPPTMFTGIAIAFANQPIYSYYLGVPRLWGLDVLSDQRISGVIMWIPGSMMYIIAVLILAARWLQGEERKPPLPFLPGPPTTAWLPLASTGRTKMKQPGGFLRPLALLLAAGLLLLLVPLAAAHGGGTPQLVNEPVGPYWLSVWTSPEPPRAGEPLHLTLALAEPGTGREAGPPVLGATVTVSLAPAQGSAAPLTVAATNANSANRLFYEADVTPPQPGPWTVSIAVTGPDGSGNLTFDVGVSERGGPNWFLWGGGGVLVIAALFLLAGRRRN